MRITSPLIIGLCTISETNLANLGRSQNTSTSIFSFILRLVSQVSLEKEQLRPTALAQPREAQPAWECRTCLLFKEKSFQKKKSAFATSKTWRNSAHTNSQRRKFPRKRKHHSDHSRFRRSISCLSNLSVKRCNRSGVDDHSTLSISRKRLLLVVEKREPQQTILPTC